MWACCRLWLVFFFFFVSFFFRGIVCPFGELCVLCVVFFCSSSSGRLLLTNRDWEEDTHREYVAFIPVPVTNSLPFFFFFLRSFRSPSLHLPEPQRVRKFDQLIKLIRIESIIGRRRRKKEEEKGKAPTGIMDDVFARVPDCRYCSRIGLFMFSLSVCSSSMLTFPPFFFLSLFCIHIHVLHIWRMGLFSSVCCW